MIQYFPFKTLTMIIGFIVLLSVSYITDRLIKAEILRIELPGANNQYTIDQDGGTKSRSQDIDFYAMSNKGANFGSEENVDQFTKEKSF
jgi:lipoprotein signal peptidase